MNPNLCKKSDNIQLGLIIESAMQTAEYASDSSKGVLNLNVN